MIYTFPLDHDCPVPAHLPHVPEVLPVAGERGPGLHGLPQASQEGGEGGPQHRGHPAGYGEESENKSEGKHEGKISRKGSFLSQSATEKYKDKKPNTLF